MCILTMEKSEFHVLIKQNYLKGKTAKETKYMVTLQHQIRQLRGGYMRQESSSVVRTQMTNLVPDDLHT